MQKLNNFYSCTSSEHTHWTLNHNLTQQQEIWWGGKFSFSRSCFKFIWQISLSESSIYTEKPPKAQDIFSVNTRRSDLIGVRGKDGEIACAERMPLDLFRKQLMLGTTQCDLHYFYYYSDRSFHHIKQ